MATLKLDLDTKDALESLEQLREEFEKIHELVGKTFEMLEKLEKYREFCVYGYPYWWWYPNQNGSTWPVDNSSTVDGTRYTYYDANGNKVNFNIWFDTPTAETREKEEE